MSKHTPGPWSSDGNDIFSGDKIVATARLARPGLEVRANTCLIAAAPDLLAQLKFLVDQFEDAVDYIPEYMSLADEARAVIAMAEGRNHANA